MKKIFPLLFILSTLVFSACQNPSEVIPVELSAQEQTALEAQASELKAELKEHQNEMKRIEKEGLIEEEQEAMEDEENNELETQSEEETPDTDTVDEQNMEQGEEELEAEVELEAEAETELEPEVFLSPEEKELVLTLKLASVYQELGQIGKGIRVYENYLKQERETYAALHNVARLHEKIGQYDQAIARYEQLVNSYNEVGYFRDIAKAYLAKEDLKKAQHYYNQWRVTNDQRDLNIEQKLERLQAKKAQ